MFDENIFNVDKFFNAAVVIEAYGLLYKLAHSLNRAKQMVKYQAIKELELVLKIKGWDVK